MSPSQPAIEMTNNQAAQSSEPAAHQPVQTTQPAALQAMDQLLAGGGRLPLRFGYGGKS
ncbi:hypothetical protein Daesc_009871 [Daldinia eschscholtzii]|uniref:Uncharacterized protein n=1 Tax=Daldinia eschscholtzii TaxID=292717 RepID=A0AAX6M6W9_9PEZI